MSVIERATLNIVSRGNELLKRVTLPDRAQDGCDHDWHAPTQKYNLHDCRDRKSISPLDECSSP